MAETTNLTPGLNRPKYRFVFLGLGSSPRPDSHTLLPGADGGMFLLLELLEALLISAKL